MAEQQEIRIVKTKRWKIGLTGLESIKQSINIICTTPIGSVPLDRNFGIDFSVLDLPYESSMAMLRVSIMDAIELYEPRAEVTEIQFETTDKKDVAVYGQIIPVIKFVEREG